jgi:nucleoside-diphosphate-sugar epimerase
MRQGKMIHENMNWTKETGGSIYGHTKYLGELEVWRGIAEGLNAVIVNPSIVLGYSNWNNGSTAIFNKVYHQLKWYTEGVTGFVYVRDVCKAMVLLMNEPISSERFIINAENMSFKEVVFSIADSFGVKRPAFKATKFLSGIAWRLEAFKSYFTGKEPLITKETAQSALATVHFDNSKLLKHFPAFQYQDVRETIRITCEKFKKEHRS